jgi:4-diphosphocytidyl-2-C-methyl-D-erythritol kinase
MIAFPKAKINIGLRIIAKRSDGYHDIETLFYPVGLSDAIEFAISTDQSGKDILTVTGINTGSATEDNIVIKAVRKLREKHPFPFLKIHLHKAIPVGAGLGGGSSDASFLLRAVNKYFKIGISQEDLKIAALELGSDCPFFIDCNPSYATGRGEILQPVKPFLEGYHIIIINPGVNINTREAYQNCKPSYPSDTLLRLIDYPIAKWKELILNDFETFVFDKYPVTGQIKKDLYKSGAIFSSVSGSGSSIFGIFRNKPKVSDSLKEFVIWEGIL